MICILIAAVLAGARFTAYMQNREEAAGAMDDDDFDQDEGDSAYDENL